LYIRRWRVQCRDLNLITNNARYTIGDYCLELGEGENKFYGIRRYISQQVLYMVFNINNIGAASDSFGAIHCFLFCESLIIHLFQIKEKSDKFPVILFDKQQWRFPEISTMWISISQPMSK